MTSYPTLLRLAVRCCMLAGVLVLGSFLHAQSTATGTIEGRVLNADNGSYLTNARVSIVGTNLQVFTDRSGQYRLSGVPAGSAQVQVFYTGQIVQTVAVSVNAGQTTTQDFSLSAGAPSKDHEFVKLDAFTVASKREMDSAAIAINEQRFAPNIKTVVSTDAFGDITEGNIGDFAKFLPGVTIDYVATDARTISLRGVPANYTSVTMDGTRVASANSSNEGRQFELEQSSLNNVARIEILKSRTPEISADALGGSVNLVPRSAFDRAHASLSYRAFVAVNGAGDKSLSKTRGPSNERSGKIKPGFDFILIRPINKDLGFTFAVLESNTYNPQDLTQPLWAPANQTAVGATPEHPYLSNYQVRPGPKINHRNSISGTLDWRPSPNDVFSFGAQWNYYNAAFWNRNATYTVGTGARPLNADPVTGWVPAEAVHGALGAGAVSLGGTSYRHKFGFTYQGDFRWRHTGPIWKLDAGLSYSHASNHYQDYQADHFENVLLRLRAPNDPVTAAGATANSASTVTVNFDDIDKQSFLLPGKITVFDKTGTQQINLADPANYNIISAGFNPADSTDLMRTARFNARRELALSFPFALKSGFQLQEQTRDIRKDNRGQWTFVGKDGKANSGDESANLYDVLDPDFANQPFGFGTPQVAYPDPYRLYALWLVHPEYFANPDPSTLINNIATNSKWFRETISAVYLMGDAHFLDNRLRIVTGVRFERTKDEAQGKLDRGVGATTGLTGVAATQARIVPRGLSRTTTYNGAYPSIDIAYNFTSNLVGRAAYARSIGRPDMNNILPGLTLPDTGTGNITVTNTTLKPTQANNYDLGLEYYFSSTGVFSVGVFRKDFTDFLSQKPVTPTVDLLESLGVPDAEAIIASGFSGQIVTKFNEGSARVTGVEFNYSQVLAASWLPSWTRNFTVFANGQQLHLQGSTLADFSNFISSSANWGVKYGVRKFSAQLNVNYRGRQRLTAQSFAPGAYEYFKPRKYIDGNIEYRWRPHVGFFVNVRNLTNIGQDSQRYGPTTPSWARTRAREIFGAQYTLGVKGEF